MQATTAASHEYMVIFLDFIAGSLASQLPMLALPLQIAGERFVRCDHLSGAYFTSSISLGRQDLSKNGCSGL